MPGPPPSAAGKWSLTQNHVPVLLAVATGLAYAGAHLVWYLGTPLGQVPVLDERENLTLAEAILQGSLPAEPFYRAPGYALLLAGFRLLGLPASALFPAALVLGVLCHGMNAALISRIATRLFSPVAGLLAGLLAAADPVLVHYATQALDAVPSLTLFLLGLNALIPAAADSSRAGPWGRASGWWAAAVLFRPNYLLAWGLLPVLGLCQRTGARWRCVLAGASGAALFVALGLWQYSSGGGFGFLPWQGAYNLWAANQPAGHGRYYTQQFPSPPGSQLNPALLDSLALYTQATGRPPDDIARMNAHWRAETFRVVRSDPLAWLRLQLRKGYALFNDWDQYNNKTYAFHRDRSPLLAWNPLSWGVLLVLGIGGFFRLVRDSPRAAAGLGFVTLACIASALLFFVSGRFRLPLAALLLVLAGGALACPWFWIAWPARRKGVLLLALLVGGTVAYSRFDHVRDTSTFIQDHALLARAADSIGDDATAWREARAALAQQPGHGPALMIAVTAHFNELLGGRARAEDEGAWREYCRQLLAGPATVTPELRTIAALALWRGGDRDTALAEWRQLGPLPSARAARLLAGDPETPTAPGGPPVASPEWNMPLVRLAVELGRLPAAGSGGVPSFSNPEKLARDIFRRAEPPP